MDIIIVTDLDGTLLDANDFTFDAIHKDIINLIENGIEFIPVSSKTRMEMMSFCSELGVKTPFIYENGAGFSINAEASNKTDIIVGMAVDELVEIWNKVIPDELKASCEFLSNLSLDDCNAILGLSGEPLRLALERSYTALFTFNGNETALAALYHHAESAGLRLQKGGRVFCLSGMHNKASFIEFLRQQNDRQPKKLIIAFGDASNDIPMLNAADIACIIPSPTGSQLPPEVITTTKIIASQPAPIGWIESAEAALALASDIGDVNYG